MTNPGGWACPPTFPHNHYFRQEKSLCGEYWYRSKNPANYKKNEKVPVCEICNLQLRNLAFCVETAERKYGAKWPEVRESIREMLSREMAKRNVKSMEEMAEQFAANSDPNWAFVLIAAAFRKNDPLTKS